MNLFGLQEEEWSKDTISPESEALLGGRTPLHIACARDDNYKVLYLDRFSHKLRFESCHIKKYASFEGHDRNYHLYFIKTNE